VNAVTARGRLLRPLLLPLAVACAGPGVDAPATSTASTPTAPDRTVEPQPVGANATCAPVRSGALTVWLRTPATTCFEGDSVALAAVVRNVSDAPVTLLDFASGYGISARHVASGAGGTFSSWRAPRPLELAPGETVVRELSRFGTGRDPPRRAGARKGGERGAFHRERPARRPPTAERGARLRALSEDGDRSQAPAGRIERRSGESPRAPCFAREIRTASGAMEAASRAEAKWWSPVRTRRALAPPRADPRAAGRSVVVTRAWG